MRSVNELALQIDEYRLIEYLKSLGTSLAQLYAGKRDIAQLLAVNPIPREKLSAKLIQLADDVGSVRRRLTNVAFQLKLTYQEEGTRVARDLDETLLGRKAWVAQLQDAVSRAASDGLLRQYKGQVASSAAALDAASGQLAKVITFHEAAAEKK